MDIKLKIFLLLIVLFQFYLIIKTVNKKSLSMRYAVLWIIFLIMLGFIVIFPELLINLAHFFGFEVASNMIFLLGFFFLFSINFMLITSISIQNNKIKVLIQEVSLLKGTIDKYGKEK